MINQALGVATPDLPPPHGMEEEELPDWRSWAPCSGAGHAAVAKRALREQGAVHRCQAPRKRQAPRRFEHEQVLHRA